MCVITVIPLQHFLFFLGATLSRCLREENAHNDARRNNRRERKCFLMTNAIASLSPSRWPIAITTWNPPGRPAGERGGRAFFFHAVISLLAIRVI